MDKFKQITSRVIPLLVNDIDTDQIIPARFLKVTNKNGLGDNLFADWRYQEDGSPNPDFILNNPAYKDAQILLAGDNFGCGSSREHAPWALTSFGIRAVISTSFADIFQNNALKNGLLPIVVDQETHEMLVELVEEVPLANVTINLETQSVYLPTGDTVNFPIDGFAKQNILTGTDELGYLMSFSEKIEHYEEEHGLK